MGRLGRRAGSPATLRVRFPRGEDAVKALKKPHADEPLQRPAVAAAYDWPAEIGGDDALGELLALISSH